jgi:hypothetical protein
MMRKSYFEAEHLWIVQVSLNDDHDFGLCGMLGN